MSKIICDVCGTRYPDTAEQCPICGCAPNIIAEPETEEPILEEEVTLEARPAVRGGRFSKANVRKRNQGVAIYDEPELPAREVSSPEEEDPFEEFEKANTKGNVILDVLLVIVILALLAVSAFIFLKFFMPNLMDKDPVAPTEAFVQETDPAMATEDATEDAIVACQQLIMEVTDITLHEAGEMFLLNVQALPENTTDTVMYISSNEDVAVVNEEGRVTAIGEGSVVISMFCGEQQVECNVICEFIGETEAPTEVATEAPAEVATEAPAEATEEATEAPTEKPAEQLKDVKLGVKTADMTFRGAGQKATIKLTCELENNEVTWTSADPAVATVDADGVITRVGAGKTTITGQYGDQKVEIIIRCPK